LLLAPTAPAVPGSVGHMVRAVGFTPADYLIPHGAGAFLIEGASVYIPDMDREPEFVSLETVADSAPPARPARRPPRSPLPRYCRGSRSPSATFLLAACLDSAEHDLIYQPRWPACGSAPDRSEERRVGKECRTQ